MPRDAQHIADELHVLLDRAEVAPPYVLVGHSFGGMYVRAYAAAHPEEVVGLVLVDSSNPDQLARSPSRSAKLEGFKRILWAAPLLVHLGIVRLSGLGNVEGFDIPPLEQAEMNAFGAAPSQSVAVLAELEGFAATANVLRAATNLNSRPLYVLTAGEGADADWPELQNELVKLSSNSVHQVLSGSTHETILFTQKGAKAVGAAILAVLEAARTGQPLAQ